MSVRREYRLAYRKRDLVMRIGGKPEVRVPKDRSGLFKTELRERYQCSEKALVVAMLEISIQGVSTWKVINITEQPNSTEFSASTINRIRTNGDTRLPEF